MRVWISEKQNSQEKLTFLTTLCFLYLVTQQSQSLLNKILIKEPK